jgi:hypothetical protein
MAAFHAIGPTFSGFIKVAAYLTLEERGTVPIKGATFQIN